MKKDELFALLNRVILGEDSREKFFDTKTTDGKVLRIDGEILQKGASVYNILEDNTIGAIDDGDYILQTGETVMVSGGRVTDFIPVAPEAPAEDAAPAEDVPADMPTDAPADVENPAEDAPESDVVEEIVAAPDASVVSDTIDWAEAVKALADEIANLKAMLGEMQMSSEAMKSHIAQFSKLPSEDEIKKEKQGFKTEAQKELDLKSANLEKIKALRSK